MSPSHARRSAISDGGQPGISDQRQDANALGIGEGRQGLGVIIRRLGTHVGTVAQAAQAATPPLSAIVQLLVRSDLSRK